MRLQLFKFIIPLFLFFGCSDKQPVDYVDPFIGTSFHGHTYPRATRAFRAVQLSPDTRRGNWDACSDYHYSDSTLLGFSRTHLSGTGCIVLGDILFHPSTGEIRKKPEGYFFEPLPFSHKNEVVKAGYYKVKLDNGIKAELTTNLHVGVHRYTFPNEGQPKILIDLAHLLENETINEAEFQVTSDEISGMHRTSGWIANQYIYFVVQFSQPFDAEVISKGEPVPANETAEGNNLQAVVFFPENTGKPIACKVDLSLVSIENARLTLHSETADFDFDRIKSETENVWNKALSADRDTAGKPEEMSNFYTALYHTMVALNVISNVNGEYRGGDQQIHQSNGRKIFSTMSIWDTFRAWNPLMTITDNTLVNNMVNSFLDFYDQTGELPVWPLSSGQTGTMFGYHSFFVIYDAYGKNFRGFDADLAFEAMKVPTNKSKKGTTPFPGLVFIPANSKLESVSCLLENANDDWCIAQMAKALGREEDFNHYLDRSKFYKNVFDGHSRFSRGRLQDGIWETPFNPFEVGRAFTEATAWQYRFFVPHDVKGMINLFAGKQHLIEALDSLFNTTLTTQGHFRLAYGKNLQITSNDPGTNIFIKEVYWNGKPIPVNFVTYSQLMEGGNLKFVLDNKPNKKCGIASETLPYSLTVDDEVSVPCISNDISYFATEVGFHCGTATEGAVNRYTLDGSKPTKSSSFYQASKTIYKPAMQLILSNNWDHYQYFEGKFSKVSEITEMGKLVDSGTCGQPDLSVAKAPDHYGINFTGSIYAPIEGIFTFSTKSDDGSLLRIGRQTVVDNDGSHADIRAVDRIAQKKGFHPYELFNFEDYEGEAFSLSWIVPGNQEEEQIPFNQLFIN